MSAIPNNAPSVISCGLIKMPRVRSINDMNNTEIVKKAYECFGTGDIPGLLELLSDDIGWTLPVVENAPFSGARKGRAAVGEFFSLLAANEDITHHAPTEFIAQNDRVVALGEITATVRSTGKTYSTDWVHIFRVTDEKITNFLEFFDNAAVTRAFQKSATA